MSESLRDLVVSLSLNTDNFTRNIKSVNKQIQEAESYFKLASAGVSNFENTTAGLESKLSTLERKLALQKDAVTQYERALTAANNKLQETHARQQDYAQRLDAAKTKQNALKGEVEKATAAYQHYKDELGETDSATIAAKANLEDAEREYADVTEKVTKLAGQQDALKKATQNAADAVSTAQTQLNRAEAAVRETSAAIEETNRQLRTSRSEWTAAGKALTDFSKKCETFSKTTGTIGRTLTRTVTTPILGLGATAIKSSMDFESAFAGVRKTVVASEKQFTELESSIKQMSTEIAADTTEIANVMAFAGQMGIETDALESFTRVMIDLGNSTNMTAEDAAMSIAKFANVMDMDQSQFRNLGSTLVDLGNNYAATETEIMEMSMRLAGAGKQVGLTESQVLGFATALSAVGIEAQMGGSALSKALIQMEVAAATGGEKLSDFATICGMTESSFQQLWKADPAVVFQAFIEGLAQMDDEGMSAIAVLDEIGIKEIRLRDTLLRSVNATELFSSTQKTAAKAWKQNTALTTEAGKRYATTASKLTNLKNKALLFAQQIGDDLNPTIKNLIDGASSLIDRFMALDEAERMQLIRNTAIAAALGPAFLAVSKLSKGISIVSGGLGRFATAVGKAGGGFGGFMSVVGKSPAVWAALATAVIATGIALTDYATGAKQAREALEGMQKTADQWKNTAAETFYNQSNAGLSFFGMSADAFKAEGSTLKKDSQAWLSTVYEAWSNNKYETTQVINDYIASFKASTDEVRDVLKEKQAYAKEAGYTSLTEQMQTDLDALSSMDREIGNLLRRRRNWKLTETDKARLQELLDLRQSVQVKYHLVPEEDGNAGFETIRKKVEAEAARAQARGQLSVPITVYENAVTASAQGMAAVNQQIDAWYDGEYALIALMTDEAEKQKALSDLNAKYNADRKAAALEYANLLKEIILPVWEQADIRRAGADIDALTQKLALFSATSEADKPKLLEELNQLTAGMNEGSLVEYLGLLTQVQSLMDSGMSKEEVSSLFPEIDFSKQLEQIAAIQDFLKGRESLLPGLASMFSEAIPEEMITLTTDLDMTGAEARWAEFAANPGAITTEAIVQVTRYIEIEGGADISGLTIHQMIAYVSAYAEATGGADTSALTPEIAAAFVKGYQELKEGADVSLLRPDQIVAYVKAYAENTEGVDTSALTPDAITAFVLAYEEITGGANTTTLAPEVIAKITAYEDAEGVVRPGTISTQVSITGYDLKAYRQFIRDNPIAVTGILRLDSAYDNPQDALLDAGISFWKDGVEVDVSLVPTEQLRPETVAVLDEDGTMHILITPELTGDKAVIEALRTEVASKDLLGTTPLGIASGIIPETVMDRIASAMHRLKSYQDTLDSSKWDKFWATLGGASTDKTVLGRSMSYDFDPSTLASLTTYVSELMTAVRNGDALAEEDYQNLLKITEFIDALELTGVGENVVAGIGDAMSAAGWETDAESVAANLEDALNTALVIHSPSVRMHPVGENVAAGIGEGASAHDFSTDANTTASNAESALMTAFGASVFKPIGIQAMNGLANGIRAGQSGVVSAMGDAANAAVTAAKKALDIHSPSRIFRDEVGRMAMKGFGEGVTQESNAQAKTILNAARYLTNAAKEGAIAPTMQTNHRTVNNSSSVNLSGNSFYIRDEQDIYALATEIATLTKRQQRGKGLRMA